MFVDQDDVERLRIISRMLGSTWKRQGLTLQGSRPLPGAFPFGLIPLSLGLLLYCLYWFVGRGPTPSSSDPFTFYLGSVFLCIGLFWRLIRPWRTLDARSRTLTGWCWYGFPTMAEPIRLESIEAVLIERESRVLKSDRSVYSKVEEVDHVWLEESAGGRILLDSFPDRPFNAHRLAEAASRLLGVEFRNLTVTPPLVKSISELDESLGQRHLRTGQPLPDLQVPPILWMTCMEAPGGLEVYMPRANLADPWKPLQTALFWTLFMTVFSLLAFDEWGWKTSLGVSLSVSLVGTFLPFWTSCQAARLTESLRLTPRSLRVDSTLYGHHEIPLEELEDLTVRDFRKNQRSREIQVERFFPVGCLCARSDRVEACFGGSLDEANLEYLRALLVHRIVEFTKSA
jgi:hypothetical protein